MKFDLEIQFISGITKVFTDTNYPQCKNATKVREHFNNCIMFMNVGNQIINKNNIEKMIVTESHNQKLESYQEKNPEYKLEDKEQLK